MTHWVIDLDGVMWRGGEPIAGSADAVARLLARGDRVLFCTNNSIAPGSEVAARLGHLGVPDGASVVTSADAVCTLVEPGERVLVFGSAGLGGVLADRGAEVVRTLDAVAAPASNDAGSRAGFDALVVGLTRELDYRQLDLAAEAVRGGARLLATNSDATFPAEDRIQPGTGALLAAVEAASGVRAVVAGKPEMPMVSAIRSRLGEAQDVIVVGDRPETDGLLAQRLGREFALVLSGVTSSEPDSPGVPVAMVSVDLAALVSEQLVGRR